MQRGPGCAPARTKGQTMTTETAATAAAEHGASLEPTDPLARASREALAMYHAAYEAGRVKEEEFRAAVHPKIWELHN